MDIELCTKIQTVCQMILAVCGVLLTALRVVSPFTATKKDDAIINKIDGKAQ